MTTHLHSKSASTVTYRADYTQPNYWVDSVSMVFDLHATHTCIATTSTLRHRENAPTVLEWVGDTSKGGVLLKEISINEIILTANEFSINPDTGILTVLNMPKTDSTVLTDLIIVKVKTVVNPTDNTTLMGLYASQGNLFTQCEAEGFRRITYAPDRPDVMSRYTVTLCADKNQYPVLLSNGNLIFSGDMPTDNQRHYAVWQDPHPKPSYLFAIVAGDLAVNETWIDNPYVNNGQSLLQIYTRPADQLATQWALDSLKASIAWDLQTFGRYLDLERYMVVAVGDFNMGAMENKGLNIFNTAYVLAQPETATDTDYGNIEAVIGHEYFHNWTGNRITCRDWFQLTLKEGLTVYRDQLFSADQAAGFGHAVLSEAAASSAKAVCRINDVIMLRAVQFGEDIGPMAHPVRPDSFEEISNFYTATVYEKGAEIIRMQALLANAATPTGDGFRRGMDIYFARHDGQAVTCDDFLQAISEGSGVDLSQFKRWYEQAGTPTVTAAGIYDAIAKRYTLTLQQHNPCVGIETANLTLTKPPLHIPILMGLLNQAGVINSTFNGQYIDEHLLHLTQAEQMFVFQDVASEPIPSLLRQFSAPVRLQYDYSHTDLALLLSHDSDAFNRWEAIQRLYERWIFAYYENTSSAIDSSVLTNLLANIVCSTLMPILSDVNLAAAFKATLLNIPSYNALADSIAHNLRPHDLYAARESVINQLAQGLKSTLPILYEQSSNHAPYSPDSTQAGTRALRNTVLMLWLRTGDKVAVQHAQGQYRRTHNMTNRIAALSGLLQQTATNEMAELLTEADDFYLRFEDNDLVIDKWFALQATLPYVKISFIQTLLAHPAFKWITPNRMRSVVFRVCFANPVLFHTEAGYAFWLNSLEQLIAINPDVAARLARAMDSWQRYEPLLAQAMQTTIQQALKLPDLPNGVAEILNKALLNKYLISISNLNYAI